MDYITAGKTLLAKYKDSEIVVAMDLGNRFLFSIRPKNYKNNDLLDPFFTVDKNTSAIEEYSPIMNPREFKDAIHNKIVYNIE